MDLIQFTYPLSRDENKIFKVIERKRKREEKEEQKTPNTFTTLQLLLKLLLK